MADGNLVVGYDGRDDAAVYKAADGTLIISTADFFPPMTGDPYVFGKIAAANALSDVYAMGGRPVMALNLACYPQDAPLAGLGEIMRGGADKIKEAGAVLAGGHSIYDKEVKYGLAVTGLVSQEDLLRNNTPKAGDHLILTKALGVGIIMAAAGDGEASGDAVNTAFLGMERLNKYSAEKLSGFSVSACTDITGFGLAGHAMEMAGEDFTVVFEGAALPLLPMAADLAEEYATGGGRRNRAYAADKVDFGKIPAAIQEICFDPQTSGGLLIAVNDTQAAALLKSIQKDDPAAALIGHVRARDKHPVMFV